MLNEQSMIDELEKCRTRVPAEDPQLIEPLRRLAAHYCEQRQPNRARTLIHEIWSLQRRNCGEAHGATVQTLSWLAATLCAAGKSDRAEAVLKGFVAEFAGNPDVPPQHLAQIWNQLVELLYQQSRMTEAIDGCQQVLLLIRNASARKIGDANAVRTQRNRARNNLGALSVARGDYRQAQNCFVRNLRDARRRLPAGDPAYIAQLSNLAALLRLRGQIAKSERLTIRAIRQCQRAHGWYHPLVAQGMSNLGAYRLQGGRPTSAAGLFRKALKIRLRLLPPGHIQVSRSRRQLAEAQLALGRLLAAERLLETTRSALEQQKPVDQLQLAQTLCSLGFVYLGLGRLANCERTLEQALNIQERLLGPQNSQLIQTLNGLGCLNAARAQHQSARLFHRRALNLAENYLGGNHPELAKTLIWLGEVELASGAVAESQQHLDRALALRESGHGPNHPLVGEVLIRCGQIALAQGQPARALSIGARARSIFNQAPERLPLAMADVLAVAGEASRRLHRYRGAESIISEELKLREQVVGLEHVSLLPAIKRIASVYLERDMIGEAEQALRRGMAIAEKTLGIMHEGGIPFAEQLGQVLIIRRDFDEANRWMDRTIKLCQRCYGDQAEQVAETLLKFSGCLRQARRESDADSFERRAIDLRNRNCHVLL